MVTERRTHGGPLHAIRTKWELARHVGEDHEGPDGRIHRVTYPDRQGRYRWSREELESTHAAMHQAVAP